jgi:HSP20 family molecular chaperone IbpA
MPRVEIKIAEPRGAVAVTLREQFDELIDKVRRRAYELFEERGTQHGADLEDWFRAEEELLFPAKFAVEEEPGSYNLRMSLPGFRGKDLKVYTLGDSLIVKGDISEKTSDQPDQLTEERRKMFYQWPLPAGADVNGITAELKEEALTIKIPVEAKAITVRSEGGEVSTEQRADSTAA